jgi:hypothetical protein
VLEAQPPPADLQLICFTRRRLKTRVRHHTSKHKVGDVLLPKQPIQIRIFEGATCDQNASALGLLRNLTFGSNASRSPYLPSPYVALSPHTPQLPNSPPRMDEPAG